MRSLLVPTVCSSKSPVVQAILGLLLILSTLLSLGKRFSIPCCLLPSESNTSSERSTSSPLFVLMSWYVLFSRVALNAFLYYVLPKRSSLQRSDGYTLKSNFVTSNVFKCLVLNAHMFLVFIHYMEATYPTVPIDFGASSEIINTHFLMFASCL